MMLSFPSIHTSIPFFLQVLLASQTLLLSKVFAAPTPIGSNDLLHLEKILLEPEGKNEIDKELNNIKKLVVFGDSLSDDGNGTWKLTNHTWPADPSYWNGHFSNGQTWPEVTTSLLKLGPDGLDDMAFGGATTDNSLIQGVTGPNSDIPVPDVLDDQINLYLSKNKSIPSPSASETIYAILIGVNDILIDPTLPASSVTTRIEKAVDKLYNEIGARSFILISQPDLEQMPYVHLMNSSSLRRPYIEFQNQQRSELISFVYNHPLLSSSKEDGSFKFKFLDFESIFKIIHKDPSMFGFSKNKTEAETQCLFGAYSHNHSVPRSLCNDPDERMWWDDYHPSRKMHRYLGKVARSVILEGWGK